MKEKKMLMLVDPHSGSHLRQQPSSHNGVIQLGGNTPNKVDSSPTLLVHTAHFYALVAMQGLFFCV